MIPKIILFCGLFLATYGSSVEKATSNPLFISFFNVQVFGKSKMSKPDVVKVLVDIVQRYDLIVIQEIRDIDEIAFPQLVDDVNAASNGAYSSILGTRVGRTSSKEQYGYIYKHERLQPVMQYEYNDRRDVFEREPYVVMFQRTAQYPGDQDIFNVIPLHAKPDDAVNEMNALVDVYDDSITMTGLVDAIIGGDLNADCSYVCSSCWSGVHLDDDPPFRWWIPNEDDTTVSTTDCAYDRIITTGQVTNNAFGAGIFYYDNAYGLSYEEAKDVSDHYPVEFYIYSMMRHILLLASFISLWIFTYAVCPEENSVADPLLVAAFNVRIFGKTKMGKRNVVKILVQIVLRYDLILIQEIRDITGTAFPALVQKVNEAAPPGVQYDMLIGEREGRTSSKEQYGFIYRTDRLGPTMNYRYTDVRGTFERPPFVVNFRRTTTTGVQKSFNFIPLHAKPSRQSAINEMNGLELVYGDSIIRTLTGDSVIAGDLNADCAVICKKCWNQIRLRNNPTYHWLIGDDVDTTTQNTNCSYDRIILTGRMVSRAFGGKVFPFDSHFGLSQDQALEVSDHYPVEFTII
ncbi:uncharacterized protein LOC120341814 [Styela clava]